MMLLAILTNQRHRKMERWLALRTVSMPKKSNTKERIKRRKKLQMIQDE